MQRFCFGEAWIEELQAQAELRQVLGRVATGELDVEDAAVEIDTFARADARKISASSVDIFKLDLSREQRTGVPEVIFGDGKSPVQIAKIFESVRPSHNELGDLPLRQRLTASPSI